MNLFKRKPKEETVAKAKHEAVVAAMAEQIFAREAEAQRERETAGRLIQRNRELQTELLSARAEADANKADAEAHRRSKANLKQFRTGKAA